MLEQQSRYDTARENKQKKEAKPKKSFPSDYCVVLKLGGASFVKVLMNARHHPFLAPTCTTNARTQRLVHTSVFAARWRSCLSAQAALSDFRGPFVMPFCVAWEEKKKKKKKTKTLRHGRSPTNQ